MRSLLVLACLCAAQATKALNLSATTPASAPPRGWGAVPWLGSLLPRPPASRRTSAGGSAAAPDSQRAAAVVAAARDAWAAYERWALGHDELRPVSKQGSDSLGHLGGTVVESLSTLWVLGLQNEFHR